MNECNESSKLLHRVTRDYTALFVFEGTYPYQRETMSTVHCSVQRRRVQLLAHTAKDGVASA